MNYDDNAKKIRNHRVLVSQLGGGVVVSVSYEEIVRTSPGASHFVGGRIFVSVKKSI